MSYELRPEEPFSKGLKRIATEEIDSALNQLRQQPKGQDEAIHEARKSSKKFRALLRLARPALGDIVYRYENMAVRDASRLIAIARDSDVLVETLDDLVKFYKDELPQGDVFNVLRKKLVTRHRAEVSRAFDPKEKLVSGTITALSEAKRRVKFWVLSDDPKPYIESLSKVYRDGRQRLKDVQHKPTPHSFHDWRKQVKYLRHQLEILQPLSPELMAPMAKAYKDLGEELGTAHDVWVLHDLLEQEPALLADVEKRALLLDYLKARQKSQELAGITNGIALYQEKPRKFVAKLLPTED
jgi:CHAD domain-containing protein